MLQALRPLLTVTAATLGGLTFTSLIDCNPSLFLWDCLHSNHFQENSRVSNFYKNKNVWIIGASSGTGQELAYHLARAGCSNLILSSRNQQSLQHVASRCESLSSSKCQCHCRPLDVSCPDGNVEELEARFEDLIQNGLLPPNMPVDIVIFNAGSGQLRPSLETPAKNIQRIMDVNALWPMILTPLLFQHDVFHQRDRNNVNNASSGKSSTRTRKAHIVVTNSIASQLPVPLSAVYAASKAAQAQYFASLVTEHPEGSLRVDLICPGPVETKFHQNHLQDAGGEDGTTQLTNNSQPTLLDETAEDGNVNTKSKTKMSVERCVHLMVTAMARNTNKLYDEIWVAPSPMISVLYLQRLFPALFHKLTTRVGQKRVQLWRQGKDLYDPKSWR